MLSQKRKQYEALSGQIKKMSNDKTLLEKEIKDLENQDERERCHKLCPVGYELVLSRCNGEMAAAISESYDGLDTQTEWIEFFKHHDKHYLYPKDTKLSWLSLYAIKDFQAPTESPPRLYALAVKPGQSSPFNWSSAITPGQPSWFVYSGPLAFEEISMSDPQLTEITRYSNKETIHDFFPPEVATLTSNMAAAVSFNIPVIPHVKRSKQVIDVYD